MPIDHTVQPSDHRPRHQNQQQRLRLLLLAATCLCVPFVPMELSASSKAENAPLPWSAAGYGATLLIFQARAEVHLRPVPAQAVAGSVPALQTVDPGATKPAELPLLIELRSEIVGQRSQSRIFLDARTGRAQLQETINRGLDTEHKIYVFGSTAVALRSASPASAQERELDPEAWTTVDESLYPHPEGFDGQLADPAAIFSTIALRSDAELDAGVRLPIFARRQVSYVSIRAVGERQVEADYTIDGDPSPAGSHNYRVIRIAPEREGDDSYRLLGLEGDLELLVHPDLRVPITITGKAPLVGRSTIRLEWVQTPSGTPETSNDSDSDKVEMP